MTVDHLQLPELRCQHCGRTALRRPIQTLITREQHHRCYAIGDPLELPTSVEGFADNDYIATRPELGVGPNLRVLDSWRCACSYANLCVLRFEEGVFVAVEPHPPSLALIRGVEFVELDLPVEWVREALLGLAPDEAERIEWMTTPELVEAAVRGHLPAEVEPSS